MRLLRSVRGHGGTLRVMPSVPPPRPGGDDLGSRSVVVVLVIVVVRVRESPTCARDETQRRGVEQRKFKDGVLS